MKRSAAPCFLRDGTRRGFTLIELCIVLFIMALLAGAAVPALHSALVEQALRGDATEVAHLVRTAMLASSEEQRSYVLKLDKQTLTLAPADASAADPDHAPAATTASARLERSLKLADRGQKSGWAAPSQVEWRFEPNGLCPLPRLRLEQGAAYVEMSFDALTGDVEDESTYLP